MVPGFRPILEPVYPLSISDTFSHFPIYQNGSKRRKNHSRKFSLADPVFSEFNLFYHAKTVYDFHKILFQSLLDLVVFYG